MKNTILIIIIALVITSCSSHRGFYNVGLKEVEVPKDVEQRYGDTKVVTLEEEGLNKYLYENDLFSVIWLPKPREFNLILQNKTNHSIKIVWDEASFVDYKGSSGRIMHSGIKYIDRNNSQPPTVIAKGAKLEKVIIPTDNVYLSSETGKWYTHKIFPFDNIAKSEEELNAITSKAIGQTVKVLLPIEIEGVVNEYIYTFKIESFVNTTK